MKRCALFIVKAVIIILPGVSALADALYRPGNLGHGEGNFYKLISEVNWYAHYGPEANRNEATDWREGFAQGRVNLMAMGNFLANPFRQNPVLLWTDDITVQASIENISEIWFRQNNQNGTDVVPHLALRINDEWFVSVKTFEHPGGFVNTSLRPGGLAAIRWYRLEFEPESVLNLKTDSTHRFDQLSGILTGFGLYYEKITERARLQEFRISDLKHRR